MVRFGLMGSDQTWCHLMVSDHSSTTDMGWAKQLLGGGGSFGGQRAGELDQPFYCLTTRRKVNKLLYEWITKQLTALHEHLSKQKLWALLYGSIICFDVALTRVSGEDKMTDSNAKPGFSWGRLFSFTKVVTSQGCGKSWWSVFKSWSILWWVALLWLVEEASFSSSVAWSSCWWRDGDSSGDVGS